MNKYKRYVRETLAFGAVGLLAICTGIIFGISGQWFLMVLSILGIIVSWDNFFCGSRLKRAGKTCNTHYILPPFLKRR